jgi:antitoxin component YwqK of YwqJK toxin-antitoxin module
MKRFLITLLLITGAAGMLNAQFHYIEKSEAGILLVDGWYNADPKLLPNDSKDVIAQKMSGVHKVGTWKHYYETGKLAVEEQYTSAGIPEGNWKQWHPDGKLSQEINYTTGKAVFYHANGAMAESGSMKGFIRVGKWQGWHQNGKVNFTGNYDAQGNKDGEWIFYDAEGNLMAKEVYNKGKFVSSGK